MTLSRRSALVLGGAAAGALAIPGTGGAAGTRGPLAVDPAPRIPLEPADTPQRILTKAAHVVPTPEQLAWQRHEITAFTHYGMNTFTDREWGSGAENPAWFAPQQVDVPQWMRAYREAGAELAMLTVKHHDGFVLHPTRYTAHSAVSSPFDGDLVDRYVTAARAAGLRVGIYLSPADGAELPHAWHARWVRAIRDKEQAGQPLSDLERVTLADGDRAPGGLGRYGNGSVARRRTIPTPVESDDRDAALASGRLPTFEVAADDYNAYYLNQLYELFTQYGPIDELWLDGANPWADSGIEQPYDFGTWYRVLHALSPETVTFQAPRGVRWIGNEDGIARESEWSVIPITDELTMDIPGGPSATDLGSRARLTTNPDVRALHWYPGEADVSIRDGWYHHEDEEPKSARELLECYEKSVGRNAVLLLNVPPSKDGRVARADLDVLASFRAARDAAYGTNLLADGPGDVVAALTDDQLSTGWSPDDADTTGSVELDLPGTREFDRISLGEDIRRGQRVEGFALDVPDGRRWRQVASGTTIGYRRILALPTVSASRIRLRITASRAIPRIASLGLHRWVHPR